MKKYVHGRKEETCANSVCGWRAGTAVAGWSGTTWLERDLGRRDGAGKDHSGLPGRETIPHGQIGETASVISCIAQVIGLLAHLHGKDAGRAPSLLLAPASLLDNWENEFKIWAPALKVYCHRGKADARLEALDAKVRQLMSLVCISLEHLVQ